MKPSSYQRAALILVALACPLANAGPIGYSVQSNGNDHLYQIDLATGAATDLGAVNFGDAEGLGFKGNQLYAIGGTQASFWNITSPPGFLVGATGARAGTDAGLDYDVVSGKMFNYQGSSGSGSLYEINVATGAATLVGSNSQFADGLGINSAGAAFVIDAVLSNSLFALNLNDSSVALVGSLGLGGQEQAGASFDSSDQLWMLLSSGMIYKVNTTTGAATLQANVTLAGVPLDSFEGLAIAAVPEPSTWAAGFALTVLVGARAWRMVRR